MRQLLVKDGDEEEAEIEKVSVADPYFMLFSKLYCLEFLVW